MNLKENPLAMKSGDELPFSKRKQVRSNTVTVDEYKAIIGKEGDLQSLCENYLIVQQVVFTRVPDAIYKAVFGYGGTIPPYIKRLIASFIRGLPDMALHKPIPGTEYCKTLFVELKTEKGKLSQEQKKFRDRLGGNVTVCRSFEQFQDITAKFLED